MVFFVPQGNSDAAKKGIGVVMRKDGTIIRRGLGQVRQWGTCHRHMTLGHRHAYVGHSFTQWAPSSWGPRQSPPHTPLHMICSIAPMPLR